MHVHHRLSDLEECKQSLTKLLWGWTKRSISGMHRFPILTSTGGSLPSTSSVAESIPRMETSSNPSSMVPPTTSSLSILPGPSASGPAWPIPGNAPALSSSPGSGTRSSVTWTPTSGLPPIGLPFNPSAGYVPNNWPTSSSSGTPSTGASTWSVPSTSAWNAPAPAGPGASTGEGVATSSWYPSSSEGLSSSAGFGSVSYGVPSAPGFTGDLSQTSGGSGSIGGPLLASNGQASQSNPAPLGLLPSFATFSTPHLDLPKHPLPLTTSTVSSQAEEESDEEDCVETVDIGVQTVSPLRGAVVPDFQSPVWRGSEASDPTLGWGRIDLALWQNRLMQYQGIATKRISADALAIPLPLPTEHDSGHELQGVTSALILQALEAGGVEKVIESVF